jgi:hypothetical protein
MHSWTVLLQSFNNSSSNYRKCQRYVISGVSVPCQITIAICDSAATATAISLLNELDARLKFMAQSDGVCDGPAELGCMAWEEPACQHILVLVIGDRNLDAAYEQLASDWFHKSPRHSAVIPALVPPLVHSDVFGVGGFPYLSACTSAPWPDSIWSLSQLVMQATLLDQRPGVFISYVREDASAAADQIHDALQRIGYRVFLDRFSGTPGHIFSSELAEAMAELDAVVVLETQNICRSKWTLSEAAFAHRNRIGPISVNFQTAPQLLSAGARRHFVSAAASAPLPTTEVDHIVEFIQNQLPPLAIKRRAHYETLIRLAARSKGGTADLNQNGVLTIRNSGGESRADALATGVPAQLRHVHRLAEASAVSTKLIAGEHDQLRSASLADLQWLAGKAGVTLVGSASIFRAVQRIV